MTNTSEHGQLLAAGRGERVCAIPESALCAGALAWSGRRVRLLVAMAMATADREFLDIELLAACTEGSTCRRARQVVRDEICLLADMGWVRTTRLRHVLTQDGRQLAVTLMHRQMLREAISRAVSRFVVLADHERARITWEVRARRWTLGLHAFFAVYSPRDAERLLAAVGARPVSSVADHGVTRTIYEVQ